MREHRSPTDDRAVSEVVGFILVFALVIGSVGLLYTTGFQSMTDFQESEQLRNAERAMDALGENFNDVAKYDGITRRSGELSLRGGTFSIEDEDTVEVRVDDGTGTESYTLASLTYDHGDGVIGYEGGGVFRGDGEGASIAVREPSIRCDTDGIASLVAIDNDQPTLQASGTTVVTVRQTNTTVYRSPNTVTFNTGDSEYAAAWDRLLDGCGPDVIRITTVEIEYNS